MSSRTTPEPLHVADGRSAEWRAMFCTQVTRDLIVDATRRAEAEIARLRRRGCVTDLCADDLVQNILTSTWQGSLKWKFATVPLRLHVHDEIRQGCRREFRRLRRKLPMRIAIESLDGGNPLHVEVEDALASKAAAVDHELADRAHRLTHELRRLAAHDSDALKALEALELGLSGNLDVAEYAGFDVRRVDSAINRLQRLGRRISHGARVLPLAATYRMRRPKSHSALPLAEISEERAFNAATSNANRLKPSKFGIIEFNNEL